MVAHDVMPRSPSVSVLIPARDAAATIVACLRSVLRQSIDAWECIVVDDGSRDATAQVAGDIASHDRRVRVVPSTGDGLIDALNCGLRACRAPYIARMDADDLMHRDRLALQAAALDADARLAAAGAHVRMFPRSRLTPRRREYEDWLNSIDSAEAVRRDAFVECPVVHPTLMARRDVLQRFEYRDCPWPEDYDLVLRMLAAGLEVGVVPRRLLWWRDSDGRASRTHARYGPSTFTACRARFLADGFLRDRREYVLWGYGDTGRLLRRALLALDRHPTHIVEVKPGRIGQRIHGVPVIAPHELAALRGTPVVVSVARVGPRTLIRQAMSAMGFVELRDYVCAA